MNDASYEKFVSDELARAGRIGMKGIAEAVLAPINCDGCTNCCASGEDRVELHVEDDSGWYEVEVVDGKSLIRVTENGDCVYLDRGHGCTIYDRRPIECRLFNCIVAVRLNIPLAPLIVAAAVERISNATGSRHAVRSSRETAAPSLHD